MPSMGDSISEGTVVQWSKEPGETVEADDVVVILETDKVNKEQVNYPNINQVFPTKLYDICGVLLSQPYKNICENLYNTWWILLVKLILKVVRFLGNVPLL